MNRSWHLYINAFLSVLQSQMNLVTLATERAQHTVPLNVVCSSWKYWESTANTIKAFVMMIMYGDAMRMKLRCLTECERILSIISLLIIINESLPKLNCSECFSNRIDYWLNILRQVGIITSSNLLVCCYCTGFNRKVKFIHRIDKVMNNPWIFN